MSIFWSTFSCCESIYILGYLNLLVFRGYLYFQLNIDFFSLYQTCLVVLFKKSNHHRHFFCLYQLYALYFFHKCLYLNRGYNRQSIFLVCCRLSCICSCIIYRFFGMCSVLFLFVVFEPISFLFNTILTCSLSFFNFSIYLMIKGLANFQFCGYLLK